MNMEIVANNYMPGDPRLIQQLVYELKSQGIFDQFRKECIADVDTKPAYQNLRQRVEGSVTSFLKQQIWRPDMNKNQVREQLRKSIYESGYLETGVERVVDQVVNPKINTVFLPQVEDVVYRYLGIEKPTRTEIKKELKIDVTDLLPTDLEAVSPESDHTDKKDDSFNLNESLNADSKTEDESPPFEPLDVQQNVVQHEENSVDSHLSGFSGLQSHDSNPYTDTKLAELSNQDSHVSHNSSESYLSIITSEENTKMEICEESETKVIKSSESTEIKVENSTETFINSEKKSLQNDSEEVKKNEETEADKKDEKKPEEKSSENKKVVEKRNEDKRIDEKKHEDKKYEKKSEDKKPRSSDKHSSSKDKRDDKKTDKYKKSNSSSNSSNSNKDKEKSSSKRSSSSSYKDKDKTKDKKDVKSTSSSSKEKDKSDKDKLEKEKDKSDKGKEKGEKDKSKSSSGTSKHTSSSGKDKEKSVKRESSSKDKEKSRSSSSSASKDSKSSSNHSDSKSKPSSDKHKKNDKSSHNAKHSSLSSSGTKKDKDKKRDSKKEPKDDHYSAKDKKNHRRSTDRDSNDGQSSRQSHSTSFSGSSSSSSQKNVQESSNSNSGSGSGDSGNSDQVERSALKSPVKLSENIENKEVIIPCVDVQKFKYIKPKFASNFQEARKLMKIRKQLAKLERQNQLSLAHIEVPVELPTINGLSYDEATSLEDVDKVECLNKKPQTPEGKENIILPKDGAPVLQSTDLSKESWEALEARLAQEMSNVNYNSYESPYDDYDCAGYNSITLSPRKNIKSFNDKCTVIEETVKIVDDSKLDRLDNEKVADIVETKKEEITVKSDIKNHVVDKIRLITVQNEDKLCSNSEERVQDVSCSLKEKEECLNQNASTATEEKNKPILSVEIEKLVANRKETTVERKLTPYIHCIKLDYAVIHRNEAKIQNACDPDEQCRYLERSSPSSERRLQFIYRYIGKLERDIKNSVKAPQNNFLQLKRGRKRKLEENVDLKNNNKAHYEQTTEVKKRRRSVAPNPNSVISKANKEKMCNSTDISPNDRFSLPLSPAESDKSNDKKEEESPKSAKQKRNVIGKNTSSRNQRYSSDDLYKPRPIFASSRRSRGAKNLGK